MALEKEAVLADKVKNSLAYKIEDLEGQVSREWFKNDLGAKNQIEIQPKLKSSTGLLKAKLIVDPSDHTHINIFEEIELQTKLGSYDTSFKVKPSEIIAQFDLGPRPIDTNWFNPYFGFKTPRSSYGGKWISQLSLGGIFHCSPRSRPGSYLRYILDFSVNPHKGEAHRAGIEVKHNIAYSWLNFVFAATDNWKIEAGESGITRRGKMSFAYIEK